MEPREPRAPHSLGGYRILARIGTGGMAVVYLGRSRGGRAVAVKVMHDDLARRPELRERFRQEVAATAVAGGVHSPPVLGADADARTPWMATEFLPSVSLREAVERFGPLPAFSVRRLAAGLAEALVAIHGAGIVHLDVKPSNVLLTADGPKLIDFGIAAGTAAGSPAGSEGFMSPEQMDGDTARIGPASDVFSLGSTLAYARGDANEANADADEALGGLIADCRHRDPSERPTAAALSQRLGLELSRDAQPADAAWLPPPVVAAITARASEADNRPPHAPDRRRLLLLLLAGAAIAAVGGGTATVFALTGSAGEEPAGRDADARGQSSPSDVTSPSSSPSPSTSPTPERNPELEPVTVEFEIRGDGPVETLTYAINGRPTTLDDITLPWRESVEMPREVGSVEYSLELSHWGEVTYRVLVDGRETWFDTSPNPDIPADFLGPGPYSVEGGGVTAFAVPSPGANA